MKFDYISFLDNVTTQSGVYQMFDEHNNIIYIGKAKNLKNRLSSYFKNNITNKKTINLVSNIFNIEVIVTNNEVEALILESNLIKKHLPKYNVLLRDDKTFSYIFISNHQHPRISFHRGAKKKEGEYFEPYPNQHSVKHTLSLLQKMFPIRQCEDGVYNNRTRPCLMHQIGKCNAPCVKGYVSDEDYTQQVKYTKDFLNGKNEYILNDLISKMEEASINLKFEKAAEYRDQIKSINDIQHTQNVSVNESNLDCIGFLYEHGIAVINILKVRNGNVLGNHNHYPKIPKNTSFEEVFNTFIEQYYLNITDIPDNIVFNIKKSELTLLQDALFHIHNKKINLIFKPKKEKLKFLDISIKNADIALNTKLNDKFTISQRFKSLETILNMNINRMECFDISHHSGEATVASCVVFDKNGILKNDYRKFNIENITGGDDYAAMNQALIKRYRNQENNEKVPDIIFIDGGKGQLQVSIEAINQFSDKWDKKPLLIGVSKGVTRKHGDEVLILDNFEELNIPKENPALHLIWHIRDESHNYAINNSRKKLGKNKLKSSLEDIEGIGSKKRKALIQYFGGLQQVKEASIEELIKVKGINKSLAETIFYFFR